MRQSAFLNISLESKLTRLGQLRDINKGNNFQESFEQCGELRPSPFQFNKLLQLLKLQKMSRFQYLIFFKKMNKGHLNMINVKYQKWPDLVIMSI